MNLKRLEKKLIEKGYNNVEVTKKGKEYYVLHICKNNVPVPLFTTTDRNELIDYLETNYGEKQNGTKL